jgi:hypothetical protein
MAEGPPTSAAGRSFVRRRYDLSSSQQVDLLDIRCRIVSLPFADSTPRMNGHERPGMNIRSWIDVALKRVFLVWHYLGLGEVLSPEDGEAVIPPRGPHEVLISPWSQSTSLRDLGQISQGISYWKSNIAVCEVLGETPGGSSLLRT